MAAPTEAAPQASSLLARYGEPAGPAAEATPVAGELRKLSLEQVFEQIAAGATV